MNQYLIECVDKGLPVIFDYDGVLFEARWYRTRINMPNEDDDKLLEAMKRGENLYTEPIPIMVDFVKKTKNNQLYILSHIHNEIEFQVKCKQTAKHYSKIPTEHILWATSPEDKIRYMEEIKKQHGGFIYIDDTHPNLIKFENHFDNSCKFFHVSSIYV